MLGGLLGAKLGAAETGAPPPFRVGITSACFRGVNRNEARADTLKSFAELHLTPAGQQIMMLFKIDRLTPFRAEQLDSVRRLRARYDALNTEGGK